MVNRYFLRSRVLQSLYSFIIVEKLKNIDRFSNSSINLAEKEFSESLGELHKLYIIMLSFLVNLKNKSIEKINYLNNKKFSHIDDNIFIFSKNKSIEIIESNKEYLFFLERYKLEKFWEAEEKLFDDIICKFKEIDLINKEDDSIIHDVRNLVNIYQDFICNNEDIDDILELKNIYWSTDIWAINGLVIKTVNNTDFLLKENKLLSVFKDNYDKSFAESIFSKVLINTLELEEEIASLSKNWDNERISEIDMILIKMGISEWKLFNEEIPTKVIINEYVEISKEFSSEKSYKFVNGILNNYLKK